MQYDAAGVGRNDLAAGLAFLQTQAARAQFAWLSANLVRQSDGQTIFRPSLIRKVGDITVGIIGLTGHDGQTRFKTDDNAVILPWQEVLPDRIAELSSKCDMIILLSDYASEQNTKIADTFTAINLIIQASPRKGNLNPRLVNKSLLAQTGKEGKYLGWMLIDWQDSKSWGRNGAVKDLAVKKQELDGINGRISRIEGRTDKEDLADNMSYQNLIKRRQQVRTTIGFLESELSDFSKTGHAPSTYENNFIALEVDLPDQPEVEKIVKTIKEEINRAGRQHIAAATDDGSKPGALSLADLPFTGWQTCANCHKPQTYFWGKTDHSLAYQALVEAEQQFNLDCLVCHVTAEYETTRISDNDADLLRLPSDLKQVGCEICHGPGRTHAVSKDPRFISRRPAVSICRRCHTPERDEEFNYANDLIRIACPRSNDQ
jgi:2',3'-cyclic-nucleotide 2'-phosphodiesterase (5'-nucleotidase family)